MRFLSLLAVLLFGFYAHSQIRVSPSQVNFYRVPVNSFGYEQYATIYNYGDKTISVDITETCPFDFQVRHNLCWNLRPYASCDVRVSFRPSREGYQSCHANIRTSEGDFASLWISGEGVKRNY